MALADLTFKLYTNSSLTTLFSGTLSVTHQSDLSDNPQDFLLYFGSASSGVKLEATSNPSVDNITLTPTDTLPEWVASTAVALGYTVEPTVDNTYRYVVTTAGTTGATEPTWPTTIGSSVTSGTAVFKCVAKSHQPTEIKLATSLAGLDSATGGAALVLGTQILAGTANAVPVHIRVTNAVTTVSSNVGYPEIGLYINNVTESAV